MFAEALSLVRDLLAPQKLSMLEENILLGAWEGETYRDLASRTGYQQGYIRDVGSNLWIQLSDKLGCAVTAKINSK